MAGRNFLFVPGPTNVPDRILRAMDRAMEDHRSSAFPALASGLLRDLKSVFKTTAGQPFIFPATGTGGWEAALVNTLSPGDRILAPRYGQFSHLWIDLAQRHGLRVDIIDVEWGEGAPADRIGEILSQDKQHEIKGVLIVHNETATGVTSDLGAVRRAIDAAQHPALLYVDGVSSIGSIDFRMDEWNVDLAVTGSQKGLMLPAGLGIVCASPKALAAREQARCPRVFFDFGDMIRANATGYFPYTPSIPMLYGLRESLAILMEEGLDVIYARHARLAEGVRAAARAWGLKLCAKAPKWYSNTVSAIMVPDGKNAADVIDVAFRRYNLALGAGLARLAGKLFRIGHLGDLNELMLLGAIAGAEMALRDVGIQVTPGSGVAAAAEHYRSTAAPLPPRPAAPPAADAVQAPPGRPSSRTVVRDGASPGASRPIPGCSGASWRSPARSPRCFRRRSTARRMSCFSTSRTRSPRRTRSRPASTWSRACCSTTGRDGARPCPCASTASTRTTCTATWWTSWSGRGTGSTCCSSPRSACPPTCTWWTPCSPRSRRPTTSRTVSGSRS